MSCVFAARDGFFSALEKSTLYKAYLGGCFADFDINIVQARNTLYEPCDAL